MWVTKSGPNLCLGTLLTFRCDRRCLLVRFRGVPRTCFMRLLWTSSETSQRCWNGTSSFVFYELYCIRCAGFELIDKTGPPVFFLVGICCHRLRILYMCRADLGSVQRFVKHSTSMLECGDLLQDYQSLISFFDHHLSSFTKGLLQKRKTYLFFPLIIVSFLKLSSGLQSFSKLLQSSVLVLRAFSRTYI